MNRGCFFHSHGDDSTQRGTSIGRFEHYRDAFVAAGFRPPDHPDFGGDITAFRNQKNAAGQSLPDGMNPETFSASQLKWKTPTKRQRQFHNLSTKVAELRTTHPALEDADFRNLQVKGWEGDSQNTPTVMAMRRRNPHNNAEMIMLWNMNEQPATAKLQRSGIEISGHKKGKVVPRSNKRSEKEWPMKTKYRQVLDSSNPSTFYPDAKARRSTLQHGSKIDIAPNSVVVLEAVD